MTQQDKKSMLQDIYNLKNTLLKIRIRRASGDRVNIKESKELKKKIARIFTKLNKKQ